MSRQKSLSDEKSIPLLKEKSRQAKDGALNPNFR